MSWTKWNGPALMRKVDEVCDRAAYEASQAIGQQSDQEVPHDEGSLMRSKFIKEDPNKTGRVVISYGGGSGTGFPAVPYAYRWHENNANFQKGRKSKYLKDPLNNTGPRSLISALENNLRRAL